jgi:hypothetical protein
LPSLTLKHSLSIVLFAVLIWISLPSSAHAHAGHVHDLVAPVDSRDDVPKEIEETLVDNKDELELLDNGDYLVNPDRGPELVTHGVDLKATMNAGPSTGFRVGDPERQPKCTNDYYQHVIYAVGAGKSDRYNSSVPEIRSIMGRMNSVLNLNAEAAAKVSADYKVLCGVDGQVKVDKLVYTGNPSFNNVVSQARKAGFNKANADYTIFLDDVSTVACGVGSYTNDQSLSVNNANNSGGDYGIIYRACWYNETPMHENAHNQGAVQYRAPHSTGSGGHCWDEYDVLCYSPDGGDKHQKGVVIMKNCRDRNYFDCNYDDYFHPNPPAGTYLAKNWNLGSRLNRFITFGPGGSTPDPGETDPGVIEPPQIDTLPVNKPRKSKANKINKWRFFQFNVKKRRAKDRIVVQGQRIADLDLYINHRKKPTLRNFKCRSNNWGSQERCVIRKPKKGRWFVGVRTESVGEGTPFTIKRS